MKTIGFFLLSFLSFATQAQVFCLESLDDLQVHFSSLFGGESSIDNYGNIRIDAETGGFGGWPEFRLSDVEVTLEVLPEGTSLQGEPAPRLGRLVYHCKRGACITNRVLKSKEEDGYTLMSLERAEQCFRLLTYMQETNSLWE